MSIKLNELDWQDQIHFSFLPKETQDKLLSSCNSIKELKEQIEVIKKRNNRAEYEPLLGVSGTKTKYQTRNVFTEYFLENDVKGFIDFIHDIIVAKPPYEVVRRELEQRIKSIEAQERQPLECMVYATKHEEKTFFSDENRVKIWAGCIADLVNSNGRYIKSMNHMLVNWERWKPQMTLLIQSCTYIKESEVLDEVIRNQYTNYDDDIVSIAAYKRFLNSHSIENYKASFEVLKNKDIAKYHQYFALLRKTIKDASQHKKDLMKKAFELKQQDLSEETRRRVNQLFHQHEEENDLILRINQSKGDEREHLLMEFSKRVQDESDREEYVQLINESRNVHKYKKDIQSILIDKLKNNSGYDFKMLGRAIASLDQNRALDFFHNMVDQSSSDEIRLKFLYLLAMNDDQSIDAFIKALLSIDSDKNTSKFMRQIIYANSRKDDLIRESIYKNCKNIKEQYGITSYHFKNALYNLCDYMTNRRNAIAIYKVDFDQLFFEFLGYDKKTNSIKKDCSSKNAKLVIRILGTIMDKEVYHARYIEFIWCIYDYFKTRDNKFAKRIDNMVRKNTGEGMPSIE